MHRIFREREKEELVAWHFVLLEIEMIFSRWFATGFAHTQNFNFSKIFNTQEKKLNSKYIIDFWNYKWFSYLSARLRSKGSPIFSCSHGFFILIKPIPTLVKVTLKLVMSNGQPILAVTCPLYEIQQICKRYFFLFCKIRLIIG